MNVSVGVSAKGHATNLYFERTYRAKVSIKGPVKNVLLLFHIMQHFQHEEDKYALYYPSNAPWFDNCVQNPSIKMQIVDFYTATCSLFFRNKTAENCIKICLFFCLLKPFLGHILTGFGSGMLCKGRFELPYIIVNQHF